MTTEWITLFPNWYYYQRLTDDDFALACIEVALRARTSRLEDHTHTYARMTRTHDAHAYDSWAYLRPHTPLVRVPHVTPSAFECERLLTPVRNLCVTVCVTVCVTCA